MDLIQINPDAIGPRFILSGYRAGQETSVEIAAPFAESAIRTATRLRYLDVVLRVRRVR